MSSPASFLFFQSTPFCNELMWKIVHLVFGARIQIHDLLIIHLFSLPVGLDLRIFVALNWLQVMKVMKILHSLNFPYYTKHGWVYEARLLKIFKRHFFGFVDATVVVVVVVIVVVVAVSITVVVIIVTTFFYKPLILKGKILAWASKKKPVITLDNYLRLNPLNTMLNGTKSV